MTAAAPKTPPPEAKPGWRALAATWLLAWLAAGLLASAAAMAVIEGGLFNATASTPHYPPVGWAAHAAFISSVKARSGDIRAPGRFSRAETVAGFREYESDCAMCHGGPGVARAAWVQGLTPTPPYLLDAARRWTPAQLYWIVGQGIKMTAMPAWRLTRTQGEVWNLVAFLEILPYLSADDYARMRAADTASSPAAMQTGGRPDRAVGAPRS